MTRLPINLLLYVAILGLAGASGWHFYQALVVEGKTPEQRKADSEQNRERFQRILLRGGDAAGKVVSGPNYGGSRSFWDALQTANFHGAEPPPPPTPAGAETAATEPVEAPKTPLDDIFVLTAIVAAGPDSRVLIRYKPTANVVLPPELAAAPGPGLDAVAGGVTRTPRVPTYGDNLGPAHHVPLDGKLWKPYDHIHLVRVDPKYAVFVRRDPKVAEDQWAEERIYPEALELPQDVLRKLAEGLGREIAPGGERASDPAEPAQPSGWVAMELTSEVAPNRFNVGSRDQQLFGSDPDRVFNQDVGTQDWRSSTGSIRGVRITRLAPGYDRYGIREGEILVALNGEPVSGKTEAIRVAKRLYKAGVRTFEAQFLTPTGQTLLRTYVAPDDR